MYDIIIIGAGPAGLTAAIYARRASKKVLVLEMNTYGGAIINTLDIENYPAYAHISGFDLATKIYNQAKELGTEVIFEKVIQVKNNNDFKEIITNNNSYKCKAIIIATGSKNRKLGLVNEDDLLESFMAYLVACYYRKKTTKEQIESFKLILSNLVQKELENNGFCHFGVDDKPYGILEQARSCSKINKILFPWATKMQVYKDEVFLMRAEGYERKLEEIYEENPKQKKNRQKV